MKRLNDIPKKDGFKAPDGYFDEFPDKIKKRIQSGKKSEKPRLLTVLKPYLYFASFFIALAFLIKLGLNQLDDNFLNPQDKQNISKEEPLYYEYETMSEEFISYELYRDIDSTADIEEEAILAYLVQDDVEFLIYE